MADKRVSNMDWWFSKGFLACKHPVLLSRRVMYNIKRFAADRFAGFGGYDYPHRIIFLAGMAMGGSTWMKNLLAGIPGYYSRSVPMPEDVQYRQDICDAAFERIPKSGYTLFKTHLNPSQDNLECIMRNGVDKILVTYRDLRDVAMSRYHRLVDYPKDPSAFDFVDYRKMGKEKALDHSIESVAENYIPWIMGWIQLAKMDQKRYHFTRYEDLKRDTKGEFLSVLRFYGIELPDAMVDCIIEAGKGRGSIKNNMKSATVLPFGLSSNFRSGKVGGWREEMNSNHIAKCKKLFGSALIELGYEGVDVS
ncbi:MAG: sulfotransferase domain-containing protein [Desulfobacteraceae bacterium]|nr:sulfotransferase domain-containing protein [Desulfobacteraceae bacterium]